MANPLTQIMNVKREEWPQVLLMFSYFLLVIATFWVLKPIKKSLVLSYYRDSGFDLVGWHLVAPQAELLAKVLNMVVALAAVMVFTVLVRSFRRQQLTSIFSIFFIVCFILFSFRLDAAGDLTVWSFYLFGDLYSTLMVATFFAFLNDSVTADKAKRLYGVILLGGVAGGPLGTTAKYALQLSEGTWMWVVSGAALVIMIVAIAAGRLIGAAAEVPVVDQLDASKKSAGHEDEAQSNPAVEGAKLVLRSRYLLSIVAVVGLYEMVSTIMDFQFSTTVIHYLEGDEIGRQFDLVFATTNWVAFGVQLLLTSFVMTRFGVGAALLFLPVAAMLGSVGFLIAPVLLFGSALNTCDNGFSYSINQSAKEALYVPTTKDEKYKAKAFIDMFVQRFAKALAVFLSLGITMAFSGFESVRWLSLVTVVILVLWIAAARYAGRVFAEKEAAQATS